LIDIVAPMRSAPSRAATGSYARTAACTAARSVTLSPSSTA
jgi:hypothetical protein